MIPRRIHYCWFGGQPMDPLAIRCLQSWRTLLPGYEIKEWNETNSPLEEPYCRAAFAARKWSRLSNYVRLHALREEGGIYLDTDMEIIRSLDPLLGHRCFVAFQQKNKSADWVNNAALGAGAGHSFLTRCIEATVEPFDRNGSLVRQPTMTTAVLKGLGLRSYGPQLCCGVSLLPCESFYPYPWYSKYVPACVTEHTYGIHHWEASWHSGWLSRLVHAIRRFRHSITSKMTLPQ